MAGRADVPRRALDEPRLNLDDLVKATGMSRSSVEKYRLPCSDPGRQPMPPKVARRLARYLRKHSERLLKIAAQLEDYGKDS